MGAGQSGLPGQPKKKKAKRPQRPKPAQRIKKKRRGPNKARKLPTVTPLTKCKLRKLKLERVHDWLTLEHEFVQNQETLKPHEERNKEEMDAIDEISGTPIML